MAQKITRENHPTWIRAKKQLIRFSGRRPSVTDQIEYAKRDRAAGFAQSRFQFPGEHAASIGTPAHSARMWKARDEWKKAEAARIADADAKRARDDSKFRSNYRAKLTRQVKALHKLPAQNLAAVTVWIDGKADRTAKLGEINRLRGIIGLPALPPLPALHEQRISVGGKLPFSCLQINTGVARKAGAQIIMRGNDARLLPCLAESWGEHKEAVTTWKNGKPRSTRAVHKNHVRSFAVINAAGDLEWAIHKTTGVMRLPEGYFWAIDQIGIKACSKIDADDDYHIQAYNVFPQNRSETPEVLAARIVEIIQRNSMLRAAQKGELGSLEGVYVCARDSIRAGNCLPGTLNFVEQFQLNKNLHYRADVLAKLAPKEPRLKIVLIAATRRHQQEMERGYSNLADHVLR